MSPEATTGKSLTVSWGTATGAVTRYELEQQRYSGSWSQKYSETALSKFLTVATDGEYTHRVRACNTVGCSAWATGARVTVGTILLAPPPNGEEEPAAELPEADLQTQVEHQRQATRLAALMRKQALLLSDAG